MKIKYKTIIITASWEERFLLGLESNIQNYNPKTIIMFYYAEYEKKTSENREKIEKICKNKKIELLQVRLSFKDPAVSWRLVEKILHANDLDKNILVDFTTMPRELLYCIFHLLRILKIKINYIYYKPKKYNETWLSRDPEKPRLVLKHSGITQLGKKTVLVIVTGFDLERTEQLIKFFEPSLILLGIQKGKQFDNMNKNVSKHKKYLERLRSEGNIEEFPINAYSKDNGFRLIKEKISKHLDNNIIMSSLGPKPSAVALYRLVRKYPQIALAYAPSKEFNINYSEGLGDPVVGSI